MKDSGSVIKNRRKELKLTQKEVGRAVGVSHVTVGNWENNIHVPSGANLMSLADKLRLKPEEIVGKKAVKESLVEIQAERMRTAYLESGEEMQAAARRMFGIPEGPEPEKAD